MTSFARSRSAGLKVAANPSRKPSVNGALLAGTLGVTALLALTQSRHIRHSLHAALKGEWTMSTGTVQLHRVLRATPERVYRASLEADALAKWIPPYGFTCKVHHMDASAGELQRQASLGPDFTR